MYFHSQNLKKEDNEKGLIHWRCWWSITDRVKVAFSISIPSHFWHIHLDLATGEVAIGISIATPLGAIWFSLEWWKLENLISKFTTRKGRGYNTGRQIGLSFHSGTFWFSIWEDPMEWQAGDPKWWKFNFTPADFFLGKQKYREETISEGDTVIDMPEGIYRATYKKYISHWKRPRSFLGKKITRFTIDIPVGIPHEGKGENSWDCGMDATYGSTFMVNWNTTIHEATRKLAMSTLKTRQRYGSLNSPEYLKWKLEGEARLNHAELQ